MSRIDNTIWVFSPRLQNCFQHQTQLTTHVKSAPCCTGSHASMRADNLNYLYILLFLIPWQYQNLNLTNKCYIALRRQLMLDSSHLRFPLVGKAEEEGVCYQASTNHVVKSLQNPCSLTTMSQTSSCHRCLTLISYCLCACVYYAPLPVPFVILLALADSSPMTTV